MTTSLQPTTPFLDLPDGIEVPGLGTLLDSEAMRDRFNAYLPTGSIRFTSCRITNLRQKTRTSCTVCYELCREDRSAQATFVYARAFSQGEFADACRRAQLTRWSRNEDGLSIMPANDLNAILYWFPNDERLDGLRRIVVPKKLQRLFHANLSEYPVEIWRVSDRSIRLSLVRYKPERRAVLRCRFRAQSKDDTARHERFVYLGLYERERLEGLALAHGRIKELASSARHWTPAALIAVDRIDALMIWDELPGRSLREILAEGEADTAVSESARSIAEMHATDGSALPVRDSVATQLAVVAIHLTTILPELRELIKSITKRLVSSEALRDSRHRSIVHGDLHPGQLLLGVPKVGIVDFDRAHAGNPMEDVGNLCAQLWLGPPSGRYYDAESVIHRFLTEYEKAGGPAIDAQGLLDWTAFALLRSASVPLGRFEAGWRLRAHEILRRVEGQLS